MADAPHPHTPQQQDITIQPANLAIHGESLRQIVGDIWQGGDSAIMETRWGTIGGQPWQAWQWRDVQEYLSGPDTEAYVALRGGEVVGFCSCRFDRGRNIGLVGYNGVSPACQGQGLGSRMMTFIMGRLRDQGMAFAGVIVANNDHHRPARRIYEKHGFAPLMNFDYMLQKL